MMKSFAITIALISTLTLSLYTAETALAATLKCVVVEVDEQTVTLDCSDAAQKLKSNTKVKVKTIKQEAAMEGC